MTTAPDFNDIQNGLITEMKKDSTLNSDIKQWLIGEPESAQQLLGSGLPAVFTQEIGSTVNLDEGANKYQYVMPFRIAVVTSNPKMDKAEEEAQDYLRLIINQLDADVTQDSKVDTSYFTSYEVETLPATSASPALSYRAVI